MTPGKKAQFPFFGGSADDLYFVGTMFLGGKLFVLSKMFVKYTWQYTLRCDPTCVWQASELLEGLAMWVKLR